MGDFINRRRGVDVRVRAARQSGATIGTCVPVIGELFFGVEASRSREINYGRLIRAISGIKCWPYTSESAEEYGRIAAGLKRIGRPCSKLTS